MRIHFIQHVPFETPGNLLNQAASNGHRASFTKMYEFRSFPEPQAFVRLIIMGGPMSVADKIKDRRLKNELSFIEKSIKQGKQVIGICLGAQLIADVLGARVYRNRYSEIGWWPVYLDENAADNKLLSGLPAEFQAFHWHRDTFDVPRGARRLASSSGCRNQAFVYGSRVIALQFHLEVAQTNIKALIENCGSDIKPGRYVQQPGEMLENAVQFSALTDIMKVFWNNLEKSV